MLKKAAVLHEISVFLLSAICWQESAFHQHANRFEQGYYDKYCKPLSTEKLKKRNKYVGSLVTADTERIGMATSWGWCQIMGGTARDYGFKGIYFPQLCEPEINLDIAAKIIKEKLDKYKVKDMAISAYNAGKPITENMDSYVIPVREKSEFMMKQSAIWSINKLI